jgi:hypothetical protein
MDKQSLKLLILKVFDPKLYLSQEKMNTIKI